jgi:transcriptional regulator with XRE-family HTH domain
MQFPEHEHGEQINNPKIQKLDKLARLLNVTILIDGIEYGHSEIKHAPTINAKEIIESYKVEDEVVEEKTETEVVKPVSKSRGRPKKS